MSKRSGKTGDKVWQQSSEITRSQIFASGTVQKWLELADKAFETDKPLMESAIQLPADSIPADSKVAEIRHAKETPAKRARAKSA